MDEVARWRGRYLPHWTRPNGTYFLTFRTADSLPAETARQLRNDFETDLRTLTRQLGRTPTDEELRPLKTERFCRTERWLDQSLGRCALRMPSTAEEAEAAIKHFDGDRYDLHAWCIMPNHVHVLLTMRGERLPTEVAGSWKKFSGRRINERLGTSGSLLQEEGFDHLVRGPHSFRRIVEYIRDNPTKAELHDWPWIGGNGELPPSWRDSPESRTQTEDSPDPRTQTEDSPDPRIQKEDSPEPRSS